VKRAALTVLSWVIGGVAILVLALVHAELGAMYPVSGGSARFPHYAFGGAAGASFGWFSWLQAATVAPIEVSAVIGYTTHYSFAQGWQHPDGTLTPSGLAVAIVLMAIISSINFLGVRALALTNSTATWWKIGVPLLTILMVAVLAGVHPGNFHAADGFAPAGAKGVLAAVATSGSIFSYLGFEQADQLAGESRNPKRDVPLAVIGSIVLGVVIYIALQVVFVLALPATAIGPTWSHVGAVLSPLAFVVASLIIMGSGWSTDWKLGVAIILGYVILGLSRAFHLKAHAPALQWRSAQWLPVYLVGLGVIVYLSPYGPLTTPVIPLWWDMLVTAMFSLVIYYWALAVTLPVEQIERMINEVVVPEEEAVASPQALGHQR
jgi:amino acid transporter